METLTIKYNPADALAVSAIQLLQRIKSIKIVQPKLSLYLMRKQWPLLMILSAAKYITLRTLMTSSSKS